MALVLRGKSKCSLCDQIIEKDDPIVMTSHFVTDAQDPLWRFSDSTMHQKCFLPWDQRALFVEKFNLVMSTITWVNGAYHHMNNDGSITTLVRDDR
jgi:hypothetical protein